MAVVKLSEPNGMDVQTMMHVQELLKHAILPDNENIHLETFNDVLDCMFLIRAKLAELYDQDILAGREIIRQEERENIQAGLDKRSEALIRKEKSLKIDSASTLRTIIKTVSAYDRLSDNKPMSKAEFLSYCADLKLSPELAGQIYLARCFDIETRRRLINENYSLLVDE